LAATFQEHQQHKMTNGQDEINTFLDNHFHEEFLGQEYLSRFNNREEAEAVFDADFEYRYNSDEGCNLDLWLIRSKCCFLTTMKICSAVVNNYDECGMKLEETAFENGGDGLLKLYIYFYLKDMWYGYVITELIPEYPYEEGEPELPPAQ